MKIGLITFHFALNYGAVLQCLALQKYLEEQGHEVQVIDYRPKYHTVRCDAWKNPFRYAEWYGRSVKISSRYQKFYIAGKSFVRCVRWNIKGKDIKKARLFSDFVQNNLKCTKKYKTLKALQKNPPKMDAYISGSDQLWNPDLLDHAFDGAYFLDFGDPNCKRITYAVSMGRDFSEDERTQLKKMCVALDIISIREHNRAAIDAIERDVHICIDPTLLLDAKDYSTIESQNKESEPYIFVYGFENIEDVKQAVNLAVDKYRCRVINGSPNRIKLSIENVGCIYDYAPDQFLSYIKNAQCVVTNSFHGTAFSIIYKKDFITVPHTKRGKRMTELLRKLGLHQVIWGTKSFSFDSEINYDKVYEKLKLLRESSAVYLERALMGHRNEDIPHLHEDTFYSDEVKRNRYTDIIAKYGYYKDVGLLKKSASGGFASAIMSTIVESRGIIYGVAYDQDYKSASYRCAETISQLEQFKGSKYFAANMVMPDGESVLTSVEKNLLEGRIVLFIGLGCEVGALKKFIASHNVDDKNLYTVDLICQGPTFASIQKDFISSLEKKYASNIVDFSMRYKKEGWTPPYVHAVFANGKCYNKPLYETDLGYAFKTYSRQSCFDCKFKGNNHVADLTIGDYWGVKPGMPEYNKNGVSIMLSRTEKGKELLNKIDTEHFFIGDADIDLAIQNNRMFEISRTKSAYYEEFGKDFKEHGLHYACVHSPGFKQYQKAALKKMIKRVLKL